MLIVQTLPDILRMLSHGIHYRNALLENYRQKTMTRGTNAVRSDVSSMFINNDFICLRRLLEARRLRSAASASASRRRAESSSYFDRLWRTGISAHSAAHERFSCTSRGRRD